jgi:hypothetical protein
LYVKSACRRSGIGGWLVAAIVEAARGRFDRLHLRTANPEAARLYERLGFRAILDVPHCTHVMTLGGIDEVPRVTRRREPGRAPDPVRASGPPDISPAE